MKINGRLISKNGFLFDGTRFHICNKEELPPFVINKTFVFYPIEKLKEMYEKCDSPFKFIYDFETLEMIVDQGKIAVFEQ